MIFFDEVYVLVLIGASVLMWTAVKPAYRTWFIAAASFFGLFYLQPKFTLILVALLVGVHQVAKALCRAKEDRKRVTIFSLGAVALVLVLLFGKYGGAFLRTLFSEENIWAQNYLVPIGISYLVFKLIAFILDVYRGTIKNPKLLELFAFILFIPTFPAGPIERYQNFADQREDAFSWDDYTQGLRRLALGYFKKVVVVNFFFNETLFERLAPAITADGVSLDLPAWKVLTFLVGSLLYSYVDLSSYADIAIGYGRLFGYRVTENMNYPIFQTNLSDYWARWHISLSSWCRNNVYFPVLASTRNNHLALYASFIVMGLWHNVGLNWFIWGCWHATGITIFSEWKRFKKRHKKVLKGWMPKPIGWGLGAATTILYSSLGFCFIMMDTPGDMLGSAVRSFRLLAAIFV